MSADIHRKAKNFRWDRVEVLPYKEDERALYKGVTRQILFCDPEQQSELRNTLLRERKLQNKDNDERLNKAIEQFQHQFKPPATGTM